MVVVLRFESKRVAGTARDTRASIAMIDELVVEQSERCDACFRVEVVLRNAVDLAMVMMMMMMVMVMIGGKRAGASVSGKVVVVVIVLIVGFRAPR